MDQAEHQLCTQLLITFKHFYDVNKWPRLAHDELLSNSLRSDWKINVSLDQYLLIYRFICVLNNVLQ